MAAKVASIINHEFPHEKLNRMNGVQKLPNSSKNGVIHVGAENTEYQKTETVEKGEPQKSSHLIQTLDETSC